MGLQVEYQPNLQLTAKSSCHVYGKGCVSCVNTKSDIMVSFVKKVNHLDTNNKPIAYRDFVDVFMSEEQARQLYNKLKEQLGE